MEKPQALKTGDKVGIISTARKISLEEVQPAINLLTDWGLEVVLGENLFAEDHQFAGTKVQRLADLQQALNNDEIKAVFCARGGYGTVQLIDQIDFSHFKKQPKWIVGYSDVTVMHNHINQNFELATLHATMPINFSTNTPEALQSLKDALFGNTLNYQCAYHSYNRIGEAKGELVGGNLSILYSLTGTVSQINTEGKILFLEDLDEYLYHIDRMMQNLNRAGMLHGLKGLLIGGMTDMNDNTIPYGHTAIDIIKNIVAEYDYPVAFGFPAGHLADNRTLIMGGKATLSIDENKTLLNF
ncbi:MAG: LD-carboxypeptidase [Flavobacteriales bacterium]|nr:LD-carboxypeptidase [Flavobacteriales bacterium]MCW8912915.1 LD-carboxypeptidase [Flavobacteriales bacterium]MCW8938482.1 LD-carboxypeptidase [Flavobacteriales bacterium]MCW8940993.1 LD-carboxypeptidase [Flavobacteriales bacterium]MCW8967775.1 LD-carboxypeptidase [Flavobacteriales bacterium]